MNFTVSRREFVILAAGGVVSACTGTRPRLPDARTRMAPARLAVRRDGRIERVALEDYVLGSTLAEVSPVHDAPAAVQRIFEVQAVLARSFAAANLGRHRAEGFDLCDTTHCQLYEPARIRTSRFAAAAREAVRRTAGAVLTYGQRPAAALFHADCGGHTAGADAVWGGAPVPYLRPTSDAVRSASHRTWEVAVSGEQLRAILNGDPRSRIGDKLRGVAIRHRDVSGRAMDVEVLGGEPRVLRGEDLRSILNRRLGARAMQSTRFSVRHTGGSYVFHGTGFGHGVGLCQLGAAARARRGESLEQILAAYFKGATLS